MTKDEVRPALEKLVAKRWEMKPNYDIALGSTKFTVVAIMDRNQVMPWADFDGDLFIAIDDPTFSGFWMRSDVVQATTVSQHGSGDVRVTLYMSGARKLTFQRIYGQQLELL